MAISVINRCSIKTGLFPEIIVTTRAGSTIELLLNNVVIETYTLSGLETTHTFKVEQNTYTVRVSLSGQVNSKTIVVNRVAQFGLIVLYKRTWTWVRSYPGVKYDLTKSIPEASSIRQNDILNCPYSKEIKEIKLPAGSYKFECWGAKGGHSIGNTRADGGKGGYSKGDLTITSPTTYYLVSGQLGPKGHNEQKANPGGYNGGGSAYYFGGAGGGATHIATRSGLLSDLDSYRDSIIIVAGGGGGACGSAASEYVFDGGNGGGTSGANGKTHATEGGTPAGGGTQSSGGSGGSDNNGKSSRIGESGSFGKGGNSYQNNNTCATGGGGGGGWYGGGGGGGVSSILTSGLKTNTAGGGGSGYINNSTLTNAETKQWDADTPINPDSNQNGYIRITVSSVTGKPEITETVTADDFIYPVKGYTSTNDYYVSQDISYTGNVASRKITSNSTDYVLLEITASGSLSLAGCCANTSADLWICGGGYQLTSSSSDYINGASGGFVAQTSSSGMSNATITVGAAGGNTTITGDVSLFAAAGNSNGGGSGGGGGYNGSSKTGAGATTIPFNDSTNFNPYCDGGGGVGYTSEDEYGITSAYDGGAGGTNGSNGGSASYIGTSRSGRGGSGNLYGGTGGATSSTKGTNATGYGSGAGGGYASGTASSYQGVCFVRIPLES